MRKWFRVAVLTVAMAGLCAPSFGADRQRDQQKDKDRQCSQTCQCDKDCQGTPIQDRDRDRDCWDDEGVLGFLKWMFGLDR